MARAWRIYRAFLVSSFVRELEFKANFLTKIFQTVSFAFFFILIYFVIYRNTPSVAGWGRGEAAILAATVFLMNAVSETLFFSLTEIPGQVRQGSLDFVLTRPVDSQFWVSLRRVNFERLSLVLVGAGMLAYGLAHSAYQPGPAAWAGYAATLAASVALFYGLNFALMATGIWFVRVDNLWILGESIVNVARYPVDIYGPGAARVLTFYVPLALLATVPARQLTQGFQPGLVALALGWGLAVVLLARAFWRFALNSYGSASS